jgi:hypothetical protein
LRGYERCAMSDVPCMHGAADAAAARSQSRGRRDGGSIAQSGALLKAKVARIECKGGQSAEGAEGYEINLSGDQGPWCCRGGRMRGCATGAGEGISR